MKNVYSAEHLFMVQQYRDLLESHSIKTFIKNEYLSGASGELPPAECWPVLQVSDDDASRAEKLILKAENNSGAGKPSWVCAQCHEKIEGQFEWCWNCGGENSCN